MRSQLGKMRTYGYRLSKLCLWWLFGVCIVSCMPPHSRFSDHFCSNHRPAGAPAHLGGVLGPAPLLLHGRLEAGDVDGRAALGRDLRRQLQLQDENAKCLVMKWLDDKETEGVLPGFLAPQFYQNMRT